MQAIKPAYHPDAVNDPLVGTQEHPDQLIEAMVEPEKEAAPLPTTGLPEKSHIFAGVLGLVFGGLGAHRFYLTYFEIGFFPRVFLASHAIKSDKPIHQEDASGDLTAG